MLSCRGLSRRGLALRYGVVALLAAYSVILIQACGSESEGAFSGGSPTDSGVGERDSGTAADTGVGDSAIDSGEAASDSGPTGPTTALFVQASPSPLLNNVRLCWGLGGTIGTMAPFPSDGVMPGSNYAGVPRGGVAALDDATSLVGSTVTVYAVDALTFAHDTSESPLTCDQIICGSGTPTGNCMREDTDYWPVATIPYGTIQLHADNVIAISGCIPNDPAGSTALCGSSWTPTSGNLHADVLQLTRSSSAPLSGIRVQTTQLSPSLIALAGVTGQVVVSFAGMDGGSAETIAALGAEGSLSAPVVAPIDAGLPVYGQLGFAVDVQGYEGGAGHLWMSLAEAQELVDPTQDPSQFYGQPRPYLVAVVGDPNQTHASGPVIGDAGYNGAGLHVLVVAAPQSEAGAEAGVEAGVEGGSATGDL